MEAWSLGWIEVKALLRRPVWILLASFSALIAWGKLVPAFSLEGSALDLAPPLSSLGGWSRAILLVLETWGGVLSPFVVLLAAGSFFSELGHREVLWTTWRGSSLRVAGIRLAAITSVGTFLSVLGAGFALLSPSVREILVTAGWLYIPLYLAFAWIRIAAWVGLARFFFYLIRSRWGAMAIIAALQFASYYVIVTEVEMSTLIELLHRSLLSWNFVSPFTPLGIIPAVFFLQGLLVASLVVVFLGAALWVQRRFPESRGNTSKTAKLTVALGILLAVTSGGATIAVLQSRVAPFTAAELWEGSVVFDRPYIWSKDFRNLVFPGEYASVRLPLQALLPAWVDEWAATKDLHRYDNVGTMFITEGTMEDLAPQSLILLHPPERPYPAELEGMVRRFQHEIQPLLERSRIWREEIKIIFAGYEEAFFLGDIFSTTEGLLVPVFFLSFVEPYWWPWPFAWAVTATSGLDELTRCYLSMYLMAGMDAKEVRDVLAWLHEEAKGGPLRELRQALAQAGEGEIVRMVCPGPRVLCRHVRMKPEAAKRVLEYWQRGEELGHENYIRTLLEGDN